MLIKMFLCRFDIKQVNCENVVDWLHNRRSFVVIFIYILALIIHFINAPYDDYLSNLNYFVNSTIVSNVSVANSTSADIVVSLKLSNLFLRLQNS